MIVVRAVSEVCLVCAPGEPSGRTLSGAVERVVERVDDAQGRLTYVVRAGSEMRDWEMLARRDTDIWQSALEERGLSAVGELAGAEAGSGEL